MPENMSVVRTGRIGQWDDYELGQWVVRTCWVMYDKEKAVPNERCSR